MTYEMMANKCSKFFVFLSEILKDTYEVVGSCNQDISRYLIPIGTVGDLSYYGKPRLSFRVSDHWNWYSSIRKCSDPNYVQCLTDDLPETYSRREEGKTTKPRFGISVCVFGTDNKYHVIYGEMFDKNTKKWKWLETKPTDIAEMILSNSQD